MDGGFGYCELGCGAGKTVNVLADAYRDAEFLGIDFNPTHVERAGAQARAANLGNAAFLAADIAELDLDGLPDFDFIAMLGLYAWVPEAVRAAILRFIAAKLRPGGLVYVSCNTLPGWSALGHMRAYFLDRATQLDGRPTEKARRILDELDSLREAGAPFFAANPVAASVLAQVRQQDLRYVVHEFFAPSWRPMAFAEVNRDMASAGLSFVGGAQVAHNFVEYAVPEAFAALVVRLGRAARAGSGQGFHQQPFLSGRCLCPARSGRALATGRGRAGRNAVRHGENPARTVRHRRSRLRQGEACGALCRRPQESPGRRGPEPGGNSGPPGARKLPAPGTDRGGKALERRPAGHAICRSRTATLRCPADTGALRLGIEPDAAGRSGRFGRRAGVARRGNRRRHRRLGSLSVAGPAIGRSGGHGHWPKPGGAPCT